jgi:chorismate synthase
MPAAAMVAAIHAGGMVAGVFEQNELIGFVYGFASFQPSWPKPNGLHSHMLAVLPAYRAKGLGKELKWFQRDWCLKKGYAWMTWTFDPLQAKNAKLNLEHLGAVANRYLINEYGLMGGSLNADLPTDRLLAYWDLSAPRVQHLAAKKALEAVDVTAVPKVLSCHHDRSEGSLLEQSHKRLRVEIPENLTELLQTDPALALEWRLALRKVLTHYFARAYTAVRFWEGAYLLERDDKGS